MSKRCVGFVAPSSSRRTAVYLLTLAAAVAGACSGPAGPAAAPSLAGPGEWTGTTSQGRPIAFTVSPDETVTSLSIGYSFNGCAGTQTISNLSIPTKPDVVCVPGPCSGTVASYRAFGYADRGADAGPRIAVNGVFLPGNRAEGQAGFFDYPGCGTAAGVTWTAIRR